MLGIQTRALQTALVAGIGTNPYDEFGLSIQKFVPGYSSVKELNKIDKPKE